ncbi:FAD-dependent oxidoreductase [Salinirubrum litoreum]|uniref:FAD-dependent oxidoreductase n=1 Tax=Salinirubrum litoreum TaxID=1126234 RepID=A0ABD5RH58_9EURY|nr:FAD-dependent oxidoreductase [Salinirubrum litoreum]
MGHSSQRERAVDHDVVIVGGGPAGCAAALFTARYGLDTVVFDKGSAALRRCAYLENYLGFPGGIDVGVFHDLLHAHVEEVGGEIVPETVVSVEREDADDPFVVETQTGRRCTASSVVAAAWYDGSYLRSLDEDAMFTEEEHHGEVEERFDTEYADADGRTPIEGLYVASPAGDRSAQAIVVAGHGAHVARCLLEDRRHRRGYSGGVAPHYDWLRGDAEFAGEWADRDRWREWFHNEIEADEVADDRLADLRERYIDRAFETRRTDEEIDEEAERGLRRLVDTIGTDRVLDAIDDAEIEQYVGDRGEPARE